MLAELIMVLLSMAPVSELRGGIPYGILSTELHWAIVLAVCVVANITAGLLVYSLLNKAVMLANKIPLVHKTYQKYVEKSQRKIHNAVEKWGVPGIAIFIAIPLPVTGVWTAAIGANALGIKFKQFAIASAIGVICAGIIVTTAMLTGSELFRIFVKV